MKKILIIGKNSYIGTSFEKYIIGFNEESYRVSFISVRDNKWKSLDFNDFDVVLHTAAIVHITNKQSDNNAYESINHILPVDLAKKAKSSGVKQFIFLSTMGVYGKENEVIGIDTNENPQTPYAKSKLAAEIDIKKLAGENFVVSIIRIPIVYGKGCKGNYNRLSSFAKTIPFFPNTHNKRSMIYIDNLSGFLKLMIDYPKQGIFFPQNSEYINTFSLVKAIRASLNMKTWELKGFNKLIFFLTKRFNCFDKVFGSFYYNDSLERIDKKIYNFVDFKKSIDMTEIR